MLTKSQSNAISNIRSLSILAIVITHILQWGDNYLAHWFNVGVQIFLFMSGYLFGLKKIGNVYEWYKKRLVRILLPFYLYLLFAIPIYFYLTGSLERMKVIGYFLNLQVFFGFIDGFGHLWFVSVIMICYFITPLLELLDISKTENSEKKYYLKLGLLCIIIQILFISAPGVVAPGIITYALGYYSSRRYNADAPNSLILILLIINLITLPLNLLKNIPEILSTLIVVYTHISLGILLFYILYKIFLNKVLPIFLRNILKKIDEYSYEIYITHLIVIIGPLSLLDLTDNLYLNLFYVLIFIIINSYILKRGSESLLRVTFK